MIDPASNVARDAVEPSGAVSNSASRAETTATVDPGSFDELRIALAMTGGVSLAVWMGGVSHEINRMLHGEGAYGQILDALRTKPRVDIVAGASAGGLNGALLAAAIANNQSLGFLRELWADRGSFEVLLRSPFDDQSPSLLKGDRVFLPALQQAFKKLVVDREHTCSKGLRDPGTPIQLTMTTTLLDGQQQVFGDDFGSVLVEPEHRGRFVFKGMAHQQDGGGKSSDGGHFSGAEACKRLALAVRCSASFPFAFEPVLCRSEPATIEADADGRPNMAGFATFSTQYTVDGGVLVNKPLGLVLDDIFAQAGEAPVRRVLAYVNPLPKTTPSTNPKDEPELSDVLAKSAVGLRSVESLAAHLEELRSQNRQVRSRRDARDSLARRLAEAARRGDEDPDPAARLRDLARLLYEPYRTSRIASGVAHIFDRIFESPVAHQLAGTTYNLRALDDVLRQASNGLLPQTRGPAPWVPLRWEGRRRLPGTAEGWHWGIWAVEDAASVVLDLIRRTQRLGEGTPQHSDLGRISLGVHSAISSLYDLRQKDLEHWHDQAGALVPLLSGLSGPQSDARQREELRDKLEEWATGAVDTWLTADEREQLRQAAMEVAETLVGARPLIMQILDRTEAASESEAESVRAIVRMLVPNRANSEVALRQLLSLEVVERALQTERRVPQWVELLQVSADAPNAFTDELKAEEKLTGDQLFHFGAFYKRSWCYNDWLWGRLDGSARVVQLLLEPQQLRRALSRSAGGDQRAFSERALECIRGLAFESEERAKHREYLKKRWSGDEARITSELAYLDDAQALPPSTLPTTAKALMRRIHLDVVCEEMPELERVSARDARDEPDRRPAKEASPPADYAPEQAVRAFEQSRVRQETLGGELGTRRLVSLASRAGVVATTVLRHEKSGLSFLRRLVQPVRGAMLVLYALGLGATRSSPVAAVVSGVVVSFSAAVLTIYIATDTLGDVPTVLMLVMAALALVGVMMLGPAKTFTLALLAVVVVSVLVVLPVLLPDDRGAGDDPVSWVLAARPFLIGAAVVGVLFMLGGFGVRRVRDRPFWWAAGVAIAVLIGVVGLLVANAVQTLPNTRASETAIALLSRKPQAPAGAATTEPSLVTSDEGFSPLQSPRGGLVARVDSGLRPKEDRAQLRFWVFKNDASAKRFVRGQHRGNNGCDVGPHWSVCWDRVGRVAVGSGAPTTGGDGLEGRHLRDVGKTWARAAAE